MAVHLTRIYTRTGDDGSTGLGDFSRVPKTDPRLVAYADVDEANCALGVALALGSLPQNLVTVLRQVQNDLFDVGADLCTPLVTDPKYPPLRIDDSYITRLEGWCDELNAGLPKLDSFILPGGTPGAALLHTARVVTRRAERSTWALVTVDAEHTNPLTARYLNRLSDLLFILCRVANPDGDVLWKPGGNRPARQATERSGEPGGVGAGGR
ncbi:MAG: cob(I)yrinic acid a,c-diamide adenosyltransferase [Pseudonocardiales bacterium]|nr:cob(I)yrinic acid a,c-diamide adenosyltransferase [Pseudonocardiales bacterium]